MEKDAPLSVPERPQVDSGLTSKASNKGSEFIPVFCQLSQGKYLK
jgi:hypothetical protein